MSTVAFAIGLTVLWVLAWGSASPANILSGLLIAVGLLVAVPDHWNWRGRPRFRPVAVARFVGHIVRQTLASNVAITRLVLSPRPRLDTAVVAVPLPDCSDFLVTVVANVIALTPGTMVLEVDREPHTIVYVHVLSLTDPDATRRDVLHLAELAHAAFGSSPRPSSEPPSSEVVGP